MTLLHDLVILYNTSEPNKIFHEVIENMLHNLFLLPTLSLEETAELCNTSTVTINRLMKKLQCPSFRAFKQQLGEVIDGYGKHNRVFPYEEQPIEDLKNNYFSFLNKNLADLQARISLTNLDTTCEVLYNAKDVHFYCEFAASHAKQQFQVDLIYSGKQVIILRNPADQMDDIKKLTSKSAVITTTQSVLKHYAAHQNMLKAVAATDATVIVIASTTAPNASRYADYTLHFKGTDTALDNYSVDVIFNLMGLAYRTKYID